VFAQVSGVPFSQGVFKRYEVEGLAELVVKACMRKNIRMLLIDEAGCLSLGAIRGMILVRDIAENLSWALSLVFIGMDDLPIKMELLPQISRRVHAYCYFDEYDVDETKRLVASLYPHFRDDRVAASVINEEVQFIHKTCGGIPGRIVTFLEQVHAWARDMNAPLDLRLLQAVQLHSTRDRDRNMKRVNGCPRGERYPSNEFFGQGDRYFG